MRIDVITLFPDFVESCAKIGVVGRAQERGLLQVDTWNPRDYALDNYRRVDERPFGGGPGMVMLIDPLRDAIAAARAASPEPTRVIYLSPQGPRLTQEKVRELAQRQRLVLLCGRYEGIDERLIAHAVDEELSIGDYVLSGGELPALVLLDAAVRLLPGVMGAADSATDESFSQLLLEYPHYTRPADWQGRRVPDVLLSGHHAAVTAWRRSEAERITRERRPDLWAAQTVASPAAAP